MARSELSGLLAVAFLVLAIVQGRTQGLVDAGPVTLAESLVVPEAQPVGVPAAAGATTATALGPQAAATTGMFMECEPYKTQPVHGYLQPICLAIHAASVLHTATVHQQQSNWCMACIGITTCYYFVVPGSDAVLIYHELHASLCSAPAVRLRRTSKLQAATALRRAQPWRPLLEPTAANSTESIDSQAICGGNSLVQDNQVINCRIVSTYGNGQATSCSAVKIGDNLLATAGKALN